MLAEMLDTVSSLQGAGMTSALSTAFLKPLERLRCRYASFYLTRNSLAFTAPSMLEDKSLGMDMTAIGGLTSMLPVAYGFSKFLSGVLGARTSPTILLAGAWTLPLALSLSTPQPAAAYCMYACSDSLTPLCSVWILLRNICMRCDMQAAWRRRRA